MACNTFVMAVPGYCFKLGDQGQGYYKLHDHSSNSMAASKPMLQPRLLSAKLIEELD